VLRKEKKMLRRGENDGVLNTQPLVVKSLSHSLSYSKCEEGKQYHEKMKFVYSIIQDIYRSKKSTLEFFRRQKKVGIQASKEAQKQHQ
jgi:PAB1-binding protein PBP1